MTERLDTVGRTNESASGEWLIFERRHRKFSQTRMESLSVSPNHTSDSTETKHVAAQNDTIE